MSNEITTYLEILRESLEDYEGEYSDLVTYLPDFYVCFLNLLDDARFPAPFRLFVNAAIAYLVSPADVIPEEEMGPAGYIDDVFLCAYVTRKIATQLQDTTILERAWEGDEPLLEITEFILKASERIIDQNTRNQILRYVGVEG